MKNIAPLVLEQALEQGLLPVDSCKGWDFADAISDDLDCNEDYCDDICNDLIGPSCLTTTCQGSRCRNEIRKRCTKQWESIRSSCGFLQISTDGTPVSSLGQTMYENCLGALDSAWFLCIDALKDSADGACANLVACDQKIWDQCTSACTKKLPKMASCNLKPPAGEACGGGSCPAGHYCCEGSRLFLSLLCTYKAPKTFCCHPNVADDVGCI